MLGRFSVLAVGLILLSYEVSCGDFGLLRSKFWGREHSVTPNQDFECQKGQRIAHRLNAFPIAVENGVSSVGSTAGFNYQDNLLLVLRGGSGSRSRSTPKTGKSREEAPSSSKKKGSQKAIRSHSKRHTDHRKTSDSSDSEDDNSASHSQSESSELKSGSRLRRRSDSKVFIVACFPIVPALVYFLSDQQKWISLNYPRNSARRCLNKSAAKI